MNRFKKSKYVIIVFVTVLLVSALLATTYSSTIVTKLGDGISLVDIVVQKPFQWFDSVKSDLAHLTRTYNENESLKKQIYQLEVKSNEAESLKTENEQLRQQVQKLQAELNSRKILVEKAGSIADASIALNKLFETAQATADQYLENIKRMEQELLQQQSAQAMKIDENK